MKRKETLVRLAKFENSIFRHHGNMRNLEGVILIFILTFTVQIGHFLKIPFVFRQTKSWSG